MARATPGASEDLASHCLGCARPLGTSSGRAREKEGRAGRCFAATGENHRGGRTLAVTRYGVAGSGKRGCGAGREAAVIHHCRDRATSAQLRRRKRRGRNENTQAATTQDTSELARSCRSIPASGSKRPNPQLRRHELDETPGESLLPHHAALEGLPARLRCATGVLARPPDGENYVPHLHSSEDAQSGSNQDNTDDGSRRSLPWRADRGKGGDR
jgi:hypothetical protein